VVLQKKSETFHTHDRLYNKCQTEEKTATRRNRSEECIVAATNQTMTANLSTDNENECGVTFVGIIQDKSNNQNISSTTSVTHNNNEDQQNHIHTSNKSNHSEIGIVSDFVSVSDKTGNTSLLSEEQLSNVNVTLYIPALFHLKKFISSQEELEWKGIVAKFFPKKMMLNRDYKKVGGLVHGTK